MSDKYPKGAFVAKITVPGGGYQKQRQMSLTEHNGQVCFDGVTLWAKDQAKERKIHFYPSTKAELDELLAGGSNRPASRVALPSDIGIYTNKKRFLYGTLRAFEAVGYVKTKLILEAGLEKIEQLNKDELIASKNTKKATDMLANSMYEIWVKTKVNMAPNIADKEALVTYRSLVANHPETVTA